MDSRLRPLDPSWLDLSASGPVLFLLAVVVSSANDVVLIFDGARSLSLICLLRVRRNFFLESVTLAGNLRYDLIQVALSFPFLVLIEVQEVAVFLIFAF